MSLWGRIKRAVKPLDTSEVCTALDAACEANRAMKVQARALRMDVACGREREAVQNLIERVYSGASGFLRIAFGGAVYTQLGEDFRELQRKLDQIE